MLYAHKGATHNVSVMSDATTNMHDSLSFVILICFVGAKIKLFLLGCTKKVIFFQKRMYFSEQRHVFARNMQFLYTFVD